METSRKERIILYGVIPIVAALIGAVATVVATRLLDAGNTADAIRSVVIDHQLNAQAKAKMIELINEKDQQFYDLIRSIVMSGSTVVAMLIGAGFFSRR